MRRKEKKCGIEGQGSVGAGKVDSGGMQCEGGWLVVVVVVRGYGQVEIGVREGKGLRVVVVRRRKSMKTGRWGRANSDNHRKG